MPTFVAFRLIYECVEIGSIAYSMTVWTVLLRDNADVDNEMIKH